jgi:hypothetical protein
MGSAASATQSHPALIQISVPFPEAAFEIRMRSTSAVVSRAIKIAGAGASRKIVKEFSLPCPPPVLGPRGMRAQGFPLISIKAVHQP